MSSVYINPDKRDKRKKKGVNPKARGLQLDRGNGEGQTDGWMYFAE